MMLFQGLYPLAYVVGAILTAENTKYPQPCVHSEICSACDLLALLFLPLGSFHSHLQKSVLSQRLGRNPSAHVCLFSVCTGSPIPVFCFTDPCCLVFLNSRLCLHNSTRWKTENSRFSLTLPPPTATLALQLLQGIS